ncbi:MAG: hypothetical protein AAGC57_20095 [Pseudomonadota bacterium]
MTLVGFFSINALEISHRRPGLAEANQSLSRTVGTLMNAATDIDDANRHRPMSAQMRWWLGGPGTVAFAILATAAMPLWLPEGSAGIDHIVFPIVLFPLTWAAAFFYVVLEGNPRRCLAVMLGAIAMNSVLIAVAFLGGRT